MARGKGKRETTPKRNKKIVEEEEEEEENIEDEIIEEEPPKRKSSKKVVVKGKNNKKGKKDEDEDELSDLDVDEEDQPAIESAENDVVISSQIHDRQPRKMIDPKTPIGQLSIQDGLSYYIQLGEDSCNPQLKYGALNLLKQLTGRRRNGPQNFGSKSNHGGFVPRGGFQQRGGRGAGQRPRDTDTRLGGRGPQRSQSRSQDNDGDLYDEND